VVIRVLARLKADKQAAVPPLIVEPAVGNEVVYLGFEAFCQFIYLLCEQSNLNPPVNRVFLSRSASSEQTYLSLILKTFPF